jgi:hypothetical protein
VDQVRDVEVDIVPDHKGEHYLELIARLHLTLKPGTYLEIGSSIGSSLVLAKCHTIAIDPTFKLKADVIGARPSCCLYQMGSDQFFADYSPTNIFGRAIDFAFLDGMHLAEYLLRDFINAERHCKRNSLVALHDCIPTDVPMARRQANVAAGQPTGRHPTWWAGDVWKVLAILQKYRPDLRIYPVDASPTGLVLVTNVNPQSTVLSDNYFTILGEFQDMDDNYLRNFIHSLDIISATEFGSFEKIARFFWL